jgi:hypothetical protein
MKTFRDTVGREWAVSVDLPAISRVMRAGLEYLGEPVKVNLLALLEADSDLLKKAIEYPPLVGGILYALCEPQCVERGVGAEEFAKAISSREVLDAGLNGVLSETVGFFPQAQRTALTKLLEKSEAFAQKARSLTEARLASGELDAAIDRLLEAELQKLQVHLTTGTGTPGNSSESQESIPPAEPTPS